MNFEWPRIITFRKPNLAVAALLLTMFVVVVALLPMSHIEKFGFLLASGFGVYLLTTAGTALANRYGRLGVLLVFCSLCMLGAAVLATPGDVLAASALEDLVPAIIGAGSGLFTGIEDPASNGESG